MSEQSEQDYKNTGFSFTAKCLVRKFVQPEGRDNIFCSCSILAGSNRDGTQRFLNASLLVSDSVKLAKALIDTELPNMPMYFTIGNLYAEPSEPDNDGTVYINYRGFLNSMRSGYDTKKIA